MRRFLSIIDAINDQVGKLVSFLVAFMFGVMTYEVVARYVFDSPTIWANEIAAFLLAGYAILGGGYVLRHGAHVNMDVLYSRFTVRQRAIVDLATSILFFLFIGVLIWKGSLWGWRSVQLSETTTSTFAPPVYVIKMAIPVGAFLILLQGLAKFVRDLVTAITGARPE